MTKAKATFLDLARQWQTHVTSLPDNTMVPKRCDQLALSCLLLAVEHPDVVSEDTVKQMKTNRQVASDRGKITWTDELTWGLCEAPRSRAPATHPAIQCLVANLNHHNSGIRSWMMEIAWFALPLLPVKKTALLLLDNVACTIVQPYMAAGLAGRLFAREEDFIELAEAYPAKHFEKQYQKRLQFVKEKALLELQAELLAMESECRKLIIESCFESDSGYCNSGSE